MIYSVSFIYEIDAGFLDKKDTLTRTSIGLSLLNIFSLFIIVHISFL